MKKYFDLHVFYSRKNGFSVPVEIETEDELLEDEVIEYATKNNLIDEDDANQVDSVVEISEKEYNDMKGI